MNTSKLIFPALLAVALFAGCAVVPKNSNAHGTDGGLAAADDVQSMSRKTEEKMKSIRIPAVEFDNATIDQALFCLERASRDYDDSGLPPEQRGVKLVLKMDASNLEALLPITLFARDISVWEALDIVTKLTNLKFRIQGDKVFIIPGVQDLDVKS